MSATAPRPELPAITPPDDPWAEQPWEAVIAPIPSLVAVKDIAPDPSFGHIEGDRAAGYHGGAICPRPECLTLVRFRGQFVPRDRSPTGDCIEITCRAAGRGSVGEIRGTSVRWTCPRCRMYQQLALEVVSREPAFHALFVRRADGGAE